MASKTEAAIQKAREALRRAADNACIARGEAQWTHGYRTAAWKCARSESDDARLHAKEMSQFKYCATTERTLDRAIRAYALAIRRSYNPIKRRK